MKTAIFIYRETFQFLKPIMGLKEHISYSEDTKIEAIKHLGFEENTSNGMTLIASFGNGNFLNAVVVREGRVVWNTHQLDAYNKTKQQFTK